MPFMVIYRTSDGTPKFEQADAIDEAALFVERLRNSDGIDEIRIYRMEEISFAFRPYYKVELGVAPPGLTRRVVGMPPATVELDESTGEAAVAPTSAPPGSGADPSGHGAEANGTRPGLFGR